MSERVPFRYRVAGLTVVEVLVALAVLGIVTAAITTTYLSSIRNNADAGMRTQSAQLLNAIGRRVAGSDPALLADSGAPLTWNYGQLAAAFPDLDGVGYAELDRHRLTITNMGTVTLGSAITIHYRIETCTQAQGGGAERCVVGNTSGFPPTPEDPEAGRLPGIN